MTSTSDETFTFSVFTPAPSDFLHPPTLPQLTNAIRRNTRTLRNRLHSIAVDSEFVLRVSAAYGLPAIPNSRAGDWYVPRPSHGSVYFKSTDGHHNAWGFSLRRLNLHLLTTCPAGAVIVDSTRRGKRFPDSLAKTVPIWCAVVNAAVFAQKEPVLFTTPLAVGESEADAIRRRLKGWVDEFNGLGLDLNRLRAVVKKPLRPLWVHPESTLPDEPPDWEEVDFTPLVLCTASRVVKGEGTEGEYIQGAGDDHEGWAGECGLTPAVFWKHSEKILEAGEEEIDEVVAAAVAAGVGDGSGKSTTGVTRVRPTNSVFLASREELGDVPPENTLVVNCCEKPLGLKDKEKVAVIDVPIAAGKKGNKALRTLVPPLLKDRRLLEALAGNGVVFVCEDGNDVAPAVAAVVLCAFFDADGNYMPTSRKREDVDKTLVKQRLAWISAVRPTANPARGLVSGVNSVLMGRDD